MGDVIDLAGARTVGASAVEVADAGAGWTRVVMCTGTPCGRGAAADPEVGDVIDLDTYDVTRWMRHDAPILDGHYSGPGMCGGEPADVVGNGTQTERTDRGWETTIRWDTDLERGATLARQYHAGIRSDVSVGFAVREQVRRTTLPVDHPHHVSGERAEELGGPSAVGKLLRGGLQLELSAVTIGADPEAVAVRGIEGSGLLTWGDRVDAMLRGMTRSLDADPRQEARLHGLIRRALAHDRTRGMLRRALDEHDEDEARAVLEELARYL
jgi:hypothetical protein